MNNNISPEYSADPILMIRVNMLDESLANIADLVNPAYPNVIGEPAVPPAYVEVEKTINDLQDSYNQVQDNNVHDIDIARARRAAEAHSQPSANSLGLPI